MQINILPSSTETQTQLFPVNGTRPPRTPIRPARPPTALNKLDLLDMEDDLNGRRPQWQTNSMEDNLNGRRP